MEKKIKLGLLLLGLLGIFCISSANIVKAATSGTCGSNLTWILNDEGILTISGHGKMDDYESVDPHSVDNACITNSPFEEIRHEIMSIIIEDGVTSIGKGAFFGCACDTIEIAGSVATIGERAFLRSDVVKVILHEGITTLETYAFDQCHNMKSINLPQSITSMGVSVFLYCDSLEELILPDNLTSFSLSNIAGCTNLKSITIPQKCTSVKDCILACQNTGTIHYQLDQIYVASGNKSFKSVDGVLFTKNGSELVCYPPGKTSGSYKISSGVTVLHQGAFSDANYLTQVDIPEGIKKIPDHAFMHGGLTSVTIPGSVKYIEPAAFDMCRSLEEVYVLGDIITIGYCAFGFCDSLKKFCFYESAQGISVSAFEETTTTIYYPTGNSTWSKDMQQDYSGTLTWKSSFALVKPVISSVKSTTKGVKVTWEKIAKADKYLVYCKTDSGEWDKVGITTNTYWAETKATKSGTKYSYRIVAVKGSEESRQSDIKSVKNK